MTNSTINWTNTMKTNVRLWLFAGSLLLGAGAPVTAWAQAAKDAPLFPDKKLEAAVRRQVFEKRDNDKPLVEADVLNLSTIDGKGMGITDLTGLEKCRSLASLDLAKNQIRKIDALTNLANIQLLILSDNQIEEVSALAGVKALQYLELSNNKVKSIAALAAVTNLASVYLANNQITDLSPLFQQRRMSSLYADNNPLAGIKGVGALATLMTLSLNATGVADLGALEGLGNLYYLFLEKNKVTDLTPLYNLLKKDNDGPKRFAPFINIYLAGNPLSEAGKKQVAAMKEIGARVNF